MSSAIREDRAISGPLLNQVAMQLISIITLQNMTTHICYYVVMSCHSFVPQQINRCRKLRGRSRRIFIG